MSEADQKDYFEKLYEVIDTPIYTSKNWYNNETKQFKPGKQHPLGQQRPPIDHRSIGSNEIVIELDARSFAQNSRYAKQIHNYLHSQHIPHYMFWSGNKSVHIHIFLEIDITLDEGKELIKEAIGKGLNIHEALRLQLTRDIIIQSGLSPELIGQGKIVDVSKLKWDDIMGKTSLIRACGGSNKKVDKYDPTIKKGGYKTWLKTLPKKKPRDNIYSDVDYPPKLERWTVEENTPIRIAKEYLDSLSEEEDKELEPIDFEGKYLNLPCTSAIIEGLDAGKRSMGAQVLSIACLLDGLSIKKAEKVIERYVTNCSQVPEKFPVSEAKDWLKWVYKLENPYWACGHCKNLGFCDRTDCDFHNQKYKEELSLFTDDNPLQIIQQKLDELIVGEGKLKMLLFLLYLTKDLPNVEWCIILDGVASSGKSHVMKKVARLFGKKDQDWFNYSRMTKASLNHIEDLAQKWDDGIVIVEELQGANEVVEQMRVAISEGELNLLVSEEVKQDDGTKGIKSRIKKVEFNCLFVTCNAESVDVGGQLSSRAWILNMDTSHFQTQKIQEYYLEEFRGESDKEVDLEKIQRALKLLETPADIRFEDAPEILQWIPNESVRGRRDVKKLISVIKASAYFHQKNREWDDGVLYADWRDVKIAMKLAGEELVASSQGLGGKDLDHWVQVKAQLKKAGRKHFSLQDLKRWLDVKRSTAKNIAVHFKNSGLVENTTRPPLPARYEWTHQDVNQLKLDEVLDYCDEKIKQMEVDEDG